MPVIFKNWLVSTFFNKILPKHKILYFIEKLWQKSTKILIIFIFQFKLMKKLNLVKILLKIQLIAIKIIKT